MWPPDLKRHWHSSRLGRLLCVDSGVQTETGADSNPPAVILAPTFTAEPARRLIVGQLGKLNNAYARWSEADPFTSGTVSLKLSIEPSGKIAKVEEVLSRLSEHRFLDMVVAEVKQWKLPLGGTKHRRDLGAADFHTR